MERTDWLDQGYDPAAARFLMLTAITHHQFDSPAWGQDEVAKLHLELTEIDLLAAQFSGAMWYPNCYDYPAPVMAAKVEQVRADLMDTLYRKVKITGATIDRPKGSVVGMSAAAVSSLKM